MGVLLAYPFFLHEWFHLDISIFLILLNIPFVYIGYKKIGKTFAIQTSMAIPLMVFV